MADMISWSEIKIIIREIAGPALASLGFGNPGATMWRHRELFVDVVHFGSPRHRIFNVEFGCSARSSQVRHPKPWETTFRTSLQDAIGREGAGWVYFAGTLAEQRRDITALTPLVIKGVSRWFAKFDDVASAREAVEGSQMFGPDAIGVGDRESARHSEALLALEQVSRGGRWRRRT